jgi:hypothetical protein
MRGLRSIIHSLFGPEAKPPTVIFDEASFSITNTTNLNASMQWEDLSEVWVVLAGDEAWWSLRSEQGVLVIPTWLIAGGDEFSQRLRGLPGFDLEAFQTAKEAEANAERDGDEFLCWRRSAA